MATSKVEQIIHEVIPVGSNLYYSLYSYSTDIKQDAFVLQAFIQTIKKVAYATTEPQIADRKIDWWLEELDPIFQQQGRHPLSDALSTVIQRHQLPKAMFVDFLEAIKKNCQYQAYHKNAELIQHCHRSSHHANLLIAKVLGYSNSTSMQFIHDLGIGFELVNVIRHMHQDAKRGCCFLPSEELTQFKINIDDILNLKPEKTSFSEIIEAQITRANLLFQQAFSKLPSEDAYSLRSFIIYHDLLVELTEELKKDNYNVLSHHTQLTPLRKLWLAHKSVKRAKKLSRSNSELYRGKNV